MTQEENIENPEELSSNVEQPSNQEEVTVSEIEEPQEQEEETKEEITPPIEVEDDYSHYSDQELRSKLVKIASEDVKFNFYQLALKLKEVVDKRSKEERLAALEKYREENGNDEGFEFKGNQDLIAFYNAFNEYDKQKQLYYKNRELVNEEVINKKISLVEELRTFLDNDDSGSNIKQINEFQNRWKELGQVSHARNKEIWSNYKALITRFYNNRQIYLQLKDLDRQRNFAAKEALCKEAEELSKSETVNLALSKLNELHDKYKSIGPVPEGRQEELWARFKAASDVLYEKKKKHVVEFKKQLDENLKLKSALVERIKELATYSSDKSSEWKEASTKVLSIQDEWKEIGPIPKSITKDLSKEFWAACKAFFKEKSAHHASLEKEREKNLAIKVGLCEKVEELVANSSQEELKSKSNEVKAIQRDWKKIGPVPRAKSEEVFERFKKACDEFFNNLRGVREEEDKVYEENYTEKIKVIEEIDTQASSGAPNLDDLTGLMARYDEIGFVPRAKKDKLADSFKKSSNNYLNKIDGISEADKEQFLLEIEVKSLRNNPNADKLLFKKRNDLKKKISDLNNDIVTWKTNIEFFARSSNAEALREEINKKIELAEKEIERLTIQLRLINQI